MVSKYVRWSLKDYSEEGGKFIDVVYVKLMCFDRSMRYNEIIKIIKNIEKNCETKFSEVLKSIVKRNKESQNIGV